MKYFAPLLFLVFVATLSSGCANTNGLRGERSLLPLRDIGGVSYLEKYRNNMDERPSFRARRKSTRSSSC